MMSGCRGTPYFRRYDRGLVLKPAISFKKSWGGYRRSTQKEGLEGSKGAKEDVMADNIFTGSFYSSTGHIKIRDGALKKDIMAG